MLANSAGAQATGQTETFAQVPTKNGVAEMSTNDPMAAVRGRKALLDNGMRCGQMVFQGDEAAALVDERTFLIDQMPGCLVREVMLESDDIQHILLTVVPAL